MDNLREFAPETGISAGGGSRIGPYRLVRELGRGFSSVVYEAADPARDRCVALKVLTFPPSLGPDKRADLAERFRREARAVAALSHPGIVALYDVGEADDGRQFLAMECLRGETLRGRIGRIGPLPVAEAVAVAVQVADALHYAHARGIVHRDVKPDNIFLQDGPGAEGGTAKLMDFGIARVLSDAELTQDGTIVGSPAYMSPEQINGQPLDARADVFSLAVTLAEAVSGAKPFDAETIPAVMQQILRHPPALDAVPDPKLRRVLARALSKNPAGRPADTAAFAEAVRRAIDTAPLSSPATVDSLTGGLRPQLARPEPFWTPASLGLGGLSLALLAALPLLAPPHRPVQTGGQVLAATRPRLVPGAGAHRRLIPAAWRPALAVHPTPIAAFSAALTPTLGPVLITERTPPRPTTRPAPARAVAARPTSGPPTAAVLAAPVPSRPLPPAARPVLAAVPRPNAARRAVILATETAPVRLTPVVRVGASREELTPERLPPTARPEADDSAGESLPPPQENGLPDSAPRPLHLTWPALPPDAPADSEGATVRVRVTVDEDGAVTNAVVSESSGDARLDRAAVEAVKGWEFDPAIRDGRSASATVDEEVKFAAR